MSCEIRNRLHLQFHITGRCNLRCKHCYREAGDVEPLGYRDIQAVIEQFKELLQEYNRRHGFARRGHINITGGEPLIRKDIGQILQLLGDNRAYFSYGVLSNGSFLNEDLIALLKQTQISFLQLSLDGDRQTHDALRTRGDFDRVLSTAQMLEAKGIPTYISFTANRDNYTQLPLVASQCRKRGITKLWSDRLVPIGTGGNLQALAIDASVMPDYIRVLKKAQGNFLTRLCYPKTKVTMNRALQFIGSRGERYRCSAGNSLITVDEFGTILPCRRMPIPCGDIFHTTLLEAYDNHEIFRQLRQPQTPKGCSKCEFSYQCRGGARCQSYAAYHSFYRPDPGCFLVKKDG